MTLLTMTQLDLANQRVMIREDLNVPIVDGKITNEERIKRVLPTLRLAIKAKARVMVLSHLGRPQEGHGSSEYSLAPVAEALSGHLGQPVKLIKHWLEGVDVEPGELVLCENVRFNQGEKSNSTELSKKMAALCDVFVMDAFATAHRAQASTVGVAEYAPAACAGPLLVEELNALATAWQHPVSPIVAIVGGSKVSTKISLLESLLTKVDTLIVGGGIANTFLAAQGYEIGQSLYEPDWVDKAKLLLAKAAATGKTIPLPVDVTVASELTSDAVAHHCDLSSVGAQECIFDVGPKTAASYASLMAQAGTILWNGPVGVFEYQQFGHGTQALAQAIAASPAYSIAGGGDTLAALAKYQVGEELSYVSTGGGAFLAFLQGETLPAVAMLEERYRGKIKS